MHLHTIKGRGHFKIPMLNTTSLSFLGNFMNKKRIFLFSSLIHWNDKGNITDWFSFDFTLEELRTLKKYQVSHIKGSVGPVFKKIVYLIKNSYNTFYISI